MSPIRTVAFATDIPQFMNDRVLDRQYMSAFPGGTVGTDLAEALIGAGFQFMTADVFERRRKPGERALLVSDMAAGLATPGVIPAVVFAFESPLIARDFYLGLPRSAAAFEHAFLYEATRDRMRGSRSTVHTLYWPNSVNAVLEGPAWADRRGIVMVSSNKSKPRPALAPLSPKRVRTSLRALISFGRAVMDDRFHPWLQSDLYEERLQVIETFAGHDQLDLFGTGWAHAIPRHEQRVRPVITRVYRGVIEGGPEGKLRVMQRYRFALCYENTAFAGFITEKLFDAFFAGCIPVYRGAPNVDAVIPREAFINAAHFPSHDALLRHLTSLSDADAERMRAAGRTFLASPAYEPFTAERYVKDVVAALTEVSRRHD